MESNINYKEKEINLTNEEVVARNKLDIKLNSIKEIIDTDEFRKAFHEYQLANNELYMTLFNLALLPVSKDLHDFAERRHDLTEKRKENSEKLAEEIKEAINRLKSFRSY